MAIAFESIHTLNAGPGTTITTTFDIGTPTNGIMVVTGNGNTSSDLVTGITWNGVAMTKLQAFAPDANHDRYIYLWILVNPASGSNDLVVTNSSSGPFFGGKATIYSGVAQTGQPDNSGTATAGTGTSFAMSLTVNTTDSWIVAHASGSSNLALSAGTDTTLRSAVTSPAIGDSNAGLATGSRTLNFTSSSQNFSGVILSIAPLAAVVASGARVEDFMLIR